MKIVSRSFKQEPSFMRIRAEGRHFYTLDMSDSSVAQLMNKFEVKFDDADDQIMTVLRDFNNNVVNMNLHKGVYTVRISDTEDRVLGLRSLGQGERLFVVAHMANALKIEVWFESTVRLLSVSKCKLFFKKYSGSAYINIIASDPKMQFCFNKLLEV